MGKSKSSSSSSTSTATEDPFPPTSLDALYPVETGDPLQTKTHLDSALCNFLDSLGYWPSPYYDRVKVLLMVTACTFASMAQFTPVPFPECRPILGVCVAAYFVCSGILQAFTTFVEKDLIYECAEFRIRTDLPRFSHLYKFIVEVGGKKVLEEQVRVGCLKGPTGCRLLAVPLPL